MSVEDFSNGDSGAAADVSGGAPSVAETPQNAESGLDIGKASQEIGASLFGEEDTEVGAEQTKTDEPPPTEETKGEPAKAVETQTPPAVQGKPSFSKDVPPNTWRKEATADWANLPEVVREEIVKREQDFFAGIEQYKGDAAIGNKLLDTLRPFVSVFEEANLPVETTLTGLLRVEETLRRGSPQQKAAVVTRLLEAYNIDPEHVSLPEKAVLPPEVERLQREVVQLQSQLNRTTSQQQAAMQAKWEGEVSEFMKNPANVHVEEAATTMAHLLRTGAAKTLSEAYEMAIWATPSIRAKETTRLQAEQAKTAQQQVAAAKKATAANVQTAAKGAGSNASRGSWEDSLSSYYREITAKS